MTRKCTDGYLILKSDRGSRRVKVTLRKGKVKILRMPLQAAADGVADEDGTRAARSVHWTRTGTMENVLLRVYL